MWGLHRRLRAPQGPRVSSAPGVRPEEALGVRGQVASAKVNAHGGRKFQEIQHTSVRDLIKRVQRKTTCKKTIFFFC